MKYLRIKTAQQQRTVGGVMHKGCNAQQKNKKEEEEEGGGVGSGTFRTCAVQIVFPGHIG